MNWQDVTGKQALTVAHWQTLGQFRARHPAIGQGKQTTLSLKEGMDSYVNMMAIKSWSSGRGINSPLIAVFSLSLRRGPDEGTHQN